MSIKDALTSEFEHLILRLEGEGHALAARFRALHDKLVDAAPKVEAEVKTDVETVAHDAQAAAAPVLAEGGFDAEAVAGHTVEAVVHAGEYVLGADALGAAPTPAPAPDAPAAPPETAAVPTADAGPAAAAEVKP